LALAAACALGRAPEAERDQECLRADAALGLSRQSPGEGDPLLHPAPMGRHGRGPARPRRGPPQSATSGASAVRRRPVQGAPNVLRIPPGDSAGNEGSLAPRPRPGVAPVTDAAVLRFGILVPPNTARSAPSAPALADRA